MNAIIYPLEQVLSVKKKRVDQAEKVVQEKAEALKREQEKLAEREKERDKVKRHYDDKLQQLRDEMDHETTTPKIQQMKAYLKIAKERLKNEEKRVKDQQDQVEVAEKALLVAKEDLRLKRLEVDKLENHKKDWVKEMKRELQIIEGRELDELGGMIYSSRKFQEKK